MFSVSRKTEILCISVCCQHDTTPVIELLFEIWAPGFPLNGIHAPCIQMPNHLTDWATGPSTKIGVGMTHSMGFEYWWIERRKWRGFGTGCCGIFMMLWVETKTFCAHLCTGTIRGPCFNIKTIFFRYGISIRKIGWLWDHLIFVMGITTLIWWLYYIEMVPRGPFC